MTSKIQTDVLKNVNSSVDNLTLGTSGQVTVGGSLNIGGNYNITGSLTLGSALSVGNGGTGLNTLATGRIPFGAGTSAFGNDGSLFWDNTNKFLGVGTSSPQQVLNIAGNFRSDAYAADQARFIIARATGTQSAPTALTASAIGIYNFFGYDGAAYRSCAYIMAGAEQTVTSTNSPGYLAFATTPASSITSQERMRIDASGNLGLGVTPSAWVTNKAFQLPSGSVSDNQSGILYYTQNGYFGSGGWTYSYAAAAAQYRQSSGQHQWFNAASGSAGAAISFTPAMTLDASGRLGVGVPSPSVNLSLNGGSLGAGTANAFRIYDDGAAATSTTSNSIGFGFNGSTGQVSYTTGISGFHTFFTTNTERMRIDSSGNVGIGNVSPVAKLDVATVAGRFLFTYQTASQNIISSVNSANSAYVDLLLNGATTQLWTGGVERARIDSAGNLYIGKTVSSPTINGTYIAANGLGSSISFNLTSANECFYYNNTNTGNITYVLSFRQQNTQVGSISVNASTTAYNTSSDISLKKNIKPANSALSSVLSLPVRQFDWRLDDEHADYGVVAQEAYEHAPEMVTQGDLWSVDYGRVTPRLVKAIQELAAKVQALEAKVQ